MAFSSLQLEFPEYGVYKRLKARRPSSPELARAVAAASVSRRLSPSVFGPTPPSVFVGRFGYPDVSLGPLVSVSDDVQAGVLDDPRAWYGLGLADIVALRASLVRGEHRQRVSARSRVLDDVQASAMSVKPFDVEVEFNRAPRFSMGFFGDAQPMGPGGEMRKFSLAGNPSIPRKVDSVAGEGLKVREALPELLRHGFEYYYLQKIFSSGVLGAEKKVVPTRWSITAMDKMVADAFLEGVRGFPELSEFRVYSNTYLFNHFEVLLLPGRWEFEQFESWEPRPGQASSPDDLEHEFEPFEGRSDYAESEGGGYYAGRFACAEGLRKVRRQARVVVFREISPAYDVPVGVWEIRENVRHAFQNAPQRFSTLKDALAHLQTRLKHSLRSYLAKSRVLTQKRLTEFT